MMSWALLAINVFYTVKVPATFDYTWQPMKTKRYFVVIVPDRVSRYSYIGFKLILNVCYAVSMTFAMDRGVKRTRAWYHVARDRA